MWIMSNCSLIKSYRVSPKFNLVPVFHKWHWGSDTNRENSTTFTKPTLCQCFTSGSNTNRANSTTFAKPTTTPSWCLQLDISTPQPEVVNTHKTIFSKVLNYNRLTYQILQGRWGESSDFRLSDYDSITVRTKGTPEGSDNILLGKNLYL